MRYGIRHFHRPVCAYPDCGNEYDGDEAEWWSNPYWPLDQAWEDDWLVLDGRLGEPVCICPEHLLHGGDGRPVPVGHAVLPPALAERCTDPRLPAVRSSCVDDVLAVLRKD